MRLAILLLSAVLGLGAAEPVTLATLGEGTVLRDGAALASGSALTAGQLLVVGGTAPARLDFAAPSKGSLQLLPESQVVLSSEDDGGHPVLVVELQRGRVEAQLDALGGFSALQVRGAALSIRVTGTIFVVDRTRRDTDYVAMVQGKVSVSLRREVAAALRRSDPPVELVAGQGMAGDTHNGLGQVQTLAAAASLTGLNRATAGLGVVPEAGFAPGAGTGGVLDTGGGVGAVGAVGDGPAMGSGSASDGAPAVVAMGAAADAPVIALGAAADAPVVDTPAAQITQQVTEEVSRAVNEQITRQIIEEVTQQLVSGPSELPTPPGPPN